ncbi:MAG: DUF3617 domain-containing protein [Rhodocyclaceae bacterium]
MSKRLTPRTPWCFALLALATPALAQLPADLPKRQPGLWEMSNTMVEMGGMGMSLRTCIDERSDELMMQQAHEMNCEKQSYRMEGRNRVVFEGVCDAEGSKATIKGIFTGDFSKAYKGEIVTTYDPPLQGMARMTMNMEARWVGACRPGQQPGDTEITGMPGMEGINLEEMMKQLQQTPR